MGELGPDALKEEPRQALPVDGRDARRCEPPDQPEPYHVEVSPQPVPLEARKRKNKIQNSTVNHKTVKSRFQPSHVVSIGNRSLVS